jgi:hypothetical protein
MLLFRCPLGPEIRIIVRSVPYCSFGNTEKETVFLTDLAQILQYCVQKKKHEFVKKNRRSQAGKKL